METILVEFTKLFTEGNVTVSKQENGITREQQNNLDSEVNDYQATIKNSFIPHEVNKTILKKIIKDLKNNKKAIIRYSKDTK